jgi:YD repeat-containing protein
MLKKTASGASIDTAEETYHYDGLGRRISAEKKVNASQISLSQFSYNDLGLVTDANETLFGGAVKQIHYGYDQAGFMTSMTYPDGNSITITPNFQGKIASIAQNAQTLVEYDYAGASTVRRKYNQPDVTQDKTYDNLGRITNIHSYHSTTDYVDLDYQYTENNQTIERKYSNTDSKDNWYYYDDLDRLIRNSDGTLDLEVYNIDELGNRDSIIIAGVGTIDYDIDDSTNRYDQIDDNDLNYDHAGNLTTDHKGYSYSYDYENRIVEITKSGGQATVAQYAYDALGRRIEKTDSIAGKTTRYYHDNNWRVLTETDENNNNKQCSYIYGNGIDEVLILIDANSNKFYYAQDHLGSVICLIGENSSIVERYEYTPYGGQKFKVPGTFFWPQAISQSSSNSNHQKTPFKPQAPDDPAPDPS